MFDPPLCYRTYSHMLGIRRALALKVEQEEEGVALAERYGIGRATCLPKRGCAVLYDAVLLSRWDTLWSSPIVLNELPGWSPTADGVAHTYYLPKHCSIRSTERPRPASRPGPAASGAPAFSAAASHRMRTAACGGLATGLHVAQSANECSRLARPC